jgi:hypothetical protein
MLFTLGVDMIFSYFTIFDVVRNQYFYLGETFVTTVPSAVNFIVAAFVIVEMADEGNEGLVFGLLSSAANLASPFSTAISNYVFGPRFFSPNLSDSSNFITDTPAFRSEVAKSFTMSYMFSFLSLVSTFTMSYMFSFLSLVSTFTMSYMFSFLSLVSTFTMSYMFSFLSLVSTFTMSYMFSFLSLVS